MGTPRYQSSCGPEHVLGLHICRRFDSARHTTHYNLQRDPELLTKFEDVLQVIQDAKDIFETQLNFSAKQLTDLRSAKTKLDNQLKTAESIAKYIAKGQLVNMIRRRVLIFSGTTWNATDGVDGNGVHVGPSNSQAVVNAFVSG